MKKVFSILITSLFLFGCQDEKPEKDLTLAPLQNGLADSTSNSANSNTETSPITAGTNTVTGLPQTTNIIPSTGGATVMAGGLNPEHGKPGHKCEVAVGAPLNSAPARTATAPAVVNQATTMPATISTPTPVPAAKTVTAKGMNPPHGEAGHRCDISVGAPLNSAPTNPAATPQPKAGANITPMDAPGQSSSLVPALQNSTIPAPSKSVAAFSGKINPAHGQPGHDCKVGVGEPLPK